MFDFFKRKKECKDTSNKYSLYILACQILKGLLAKMYRNKIIFSRTLSLKALSDQERMIYLCRFLKIDYIQLVFFLKVICGFLLQ